MAKFNVTTPAPGHTGAVGKVHFVDGAAVIDDETNPAELAYCRAQGYGVEPIEEEKAARTSRKAPAKAATDPKTPEVKTPEVKNPADEKKEG